MSGYGADYPAADRYKLKLKGAGLRLVYEARDDEVVVVVIAVGKRERNPLYKMAAKPLSRRMRPRSTFFNV